MAPMEKIYLEYKDKNLFRSPWKINPPNEMKDKAKYFIFHQDFGRLTNDYKVLFGKIINITKKGGLTQYEKGKLEYPPKEQ